jgi:hypothetical protein
VDKRHMMESPHITNEYLCKKDPWSLGKWGKI